jgi:hypothetical protein
MFEASNFDFSSHSDGSVMERDATSLDNATIELPEVIRRYQDAHDRHDTGAALATFAPDGRVVDDGHGHVGTYEIRHWLDTTASEFTYTRTLVDFEPLDAGAWLVVNHLEGDFPGGQVDLRYRFQLADDLITELVIAP